MFGGDFFRTRMGHTFFEVTLPSLVEAVKDLTTTLKALMVHREGCACCAQIASRAARAQVGDHDEG